MNPYEATIAIEAKPSTSKMYRRSRLSFYSCVACTSILMPMAVIPIARFITQTYRPNMGTWVIPYGVLVLLLCIPIGLIAAFFARWMRRCISANPLLPLAIAVGLFALPYVMIPWLRGAQITFLAQMGLLLLWTAGGPFFLGTLLYFVLQIKHPRDDDGQWPAPNCWN